jgi:uncharacterized membrane protein
VFEVLLGNRSEAARGISEDHSDLIAGGHTADDPHWSGRNECRGVTRRERSDCELAGSARRATPVVDQRGGERRRN